MPSAHPVVRAGSKCLHVPRSREPKGLSCWHLSIARLQLGAGERRGRLTACAPRYCPPCHQVPEMVVRRRAIAEECRQRRNFVPRSLSHQVVAGAPLPRASYRLGRVHTLRKRSNRNMRFGIIIATGTMTRMPVAQTTATPFRSAAWVSSHL